VDVIAEDIILTGLTITTIIITKLYN